MFRGAWVVLTAMVASRYSLHRSTVQGETYLKLIGQDLVEIWMRKGSCG